MHHLRLNKKPIDTQSQKDKFCMAAVNTNNTPYTLFKGVVLYIQTRNQHTPRITYTSPTNIIM